MIQRIFSLSGLTFAFALIFIVINPEMRSHARSVFIPNTRVILALAKAPLDDSGEDLQILKVKNEQGLFIEVYGQEKIGNMMFPKLLASAKMPDKKDGYFTYNGQVTNMAIDKINNDTQREILVTSYDENMVAHLNVYKYIKGQRDLTLVKLAD